MILRETRNSYSWRSKKLNMLKKLICYFFGHKAKKDSQYFNNKNIVVEIGRLYCGRCKQANPAGYINSPRLLC